MESLEDVKITLDQLRRIGRNGQEFWLARDLHPPLGYVKWVDFLAVIEKAQMACESAGTDPKNHFAAVSKLVKIGSGAQRRVGDFFVSRYGAYLIAMNGNSKLPEIAAAQNYFAVQTRKQEITEEFGIDVSKRFELRGRVKDANIHLGDAAKKAGVQNYALFHAAGYRGLYGMNLGEIKEKKGISPNEDLLDRAGRAELAANEFRITQAESIIRRENVSGELNARNTHERVGKTVRDTIQKLGGTMPEDLPAEPSLKKLSRQIKNQDSLPGPDEKKDSD